MEFREYSNPEEADYDINCSLNNSYQNSYQGYQADFGIYMQLYDLIGILEDIDEDELLETYGITMQEYLRPTEEIVKKVSDKINSNQNRRCK